MKKVAFTIVLACVLLLGCSCMISITASASLIDSSIKKCSQTTSIKNQKLCLANIPIAMQSKPHTNKNQKPSSTDSVIALLLYPHIDKAIQNYFGKPTQFALYEAKVNSINQIGTDFSYQVTITVPTFYGPHNPPYGLETMTFTIETYGVTLDNYVHKDWSRGRGC